MFKIGDKIIYHGEEREIVCIVPPMVCPVQHPEKVLGPIGKYDTSLLGGGTRQIVSYLIFVLGKKRKDGTRRKARLVWPKEGAIHEIKRPKSTVKKPVVKKKTIK